MRGRPFLSPSSSPQAAWHYSAPPNLLRGRACPGRPPLSVVVVFVCGRFTSSARTLAHASRMVALVGNLLPFQSWQPRGWRWLRSRAVVPAVVVLPCGGLQGQLLWAAVALLGCTSRSETAQRTAHRGPHIIALACLRFFVASGEAGELHLSSLPCARVAVGARLAVLGEGCIAR